MEFKAPNRKQPEVLLTSQNTCFCGGDKFYRLEDETLECAKCGRWLEEVE